VTRRFPALKYLDRVKLQPVISFDIPSYVLHSVLPPAQPSFFDSAQQQSLVVDFLKKWVPFLSVLSVLSGLSGLPSSLLSPPLLKRSSCAFKFGRFFELYDKNRQGLLEVYTDFSFFSLAVSTIDSPKEKDKQKSLQNYLQTSRNLLRVSEAALPSFVRQCHLGAHSLTHNHTQIEDMERRVELLQKGRVEIVHMQSQLPASLHQVQTFTIDSYALPPVGTLQVIALNIHGHFWEGMPKAYSTRNRLLICTLPFAHASGNRNESLL